MIFMDIYAMALFEVSLCGMQDNFCSREPGLSDDVQRILQELTALHKTENAKVALRARQVSVPCIFSSLLYHIGLSFGLYVFKTQR